MQDEDDSDDELFRSKGSAKNEPQAQTSGVDAIDSYR